MKYIITVIAVCLASMFNTENPHYLVVEETDYNVENRVEIVAKVNDIIEASNIVSSITNTYFAGLEYRSFYLIDNSAQNDPFRHRPDEITPLQADLDYSVDIEVIEKDPNHWQQEHAYNIRAIDDSDAKAKGKKIQKELFKDKPCKIEVKYGKSSNKR